MSYFKKCNLIVGWIAFAISAAVYLMTMEPTASLWDCSEFIATSYKLEVGHPPGAPLFMMISRLFTMLAPDTAHVAVMVNTMSSLASGFTILFLFWSITHLARRIYSVPRKDLSKTQTWTILGAGLIGALAYTFTDTFWFSAVEGEVYALSSMFTALVFWAMLQWENVADEPHSNRWLILIAYLMGLSIGIHILNLLTIPALVFVYYFRKYPKATKWGVVKTTLVAGLILLAINSLIIPYTVAIGAAFDYAFVNGLGLPVNTGLLFFVVAVFVLIGWGIWFTHRRGRVTMNTILLCTAVVLIGYCSYASVVIRASANPPMNSNDPDNPYALLSLLNRDQYGSRPLLKGVPYSAPAIGIKETETRYIGEDGTYKTGSTITAMEYPDEFQTFFPRMWSSSKAAEYENWTNLKGRKIYYQGETFTVPTFGENLRFFFSYQLNFMYWRYFLWNFVGRQSDKQSTGQITDGQWLSGIKAIDRLYLGPQDNLPSDMADNKGRNTYYFLPFILGIVGIIYQVNRDPKNFTVVMWLFVMMGIALVFYFNTAPSEPRERDYVYAGSFYAFCIWIGFGVMAVKGLLAWIFKRDNRWIAVGATAVCSCVPIILAAQNWDDHDRSHRYVARDIGYNYLISTLPNSIIVNYGDNDTFPLWYNQEVEGVRKDVRVMNMSYLGGDWYIDQMRIKADTSAAIPHSLPRSKYLNAPDQMLVYDVADTPTLQQVMDFVRSDDPRTRTRFGNRMVDYIPAKRIALPVNKENAIASGIVRPEEAHLMVDTVYINLKGRSILKQDLIFLDLLASFDWKRPLFFTQSYLLDDYGLREYLQFDGYAFRLVPIRTPLESPLEVGRMDPEYAYPLLMEQFRYGNIADKRVYVDGFTQDNFGVAQTRNAFARLAKEYIKRGDDSTAVKILDTALQKLPSPQLRHSYVQTLPLIEAYYMAGATDKGDALLNEYATILKEYVVYYGNFPESKAALVDRDLSLAAGELGELYRLASYYERTQAADSLERFFMTVQ